VAAAAKEAGMEHDSNNNGPFSFAQNNHLIHWEGKFGCGTMVKTVLIMMVVAETLTLLLHTTENSQCWLQVINAGGKFHGVRMDDKCNNDGRTVGAFGTFPQNPHRQPLQPTAASGMMTMCT
jgi:hypothetical protein